MGERKWFVGVMVAMMGVMVIGLVGKEQTPLRFAIQGDIHNFRRIPKNYLQKLLADAKEIGCSFVAFLGDHFNGMKENPMQLSKESPLPILWQRGDHEFFNEWGRTNFVRLSQRHHLLGEAPDPLVFFRGAIPRFEAMTGQPTCWSFTLQGILFVVTHNGKNHVWHDWQLRWLRQILSENRQRTTVILSHRTLDERGETADALRKLLSEFPQVVLFCDAHTHSPHPFRLIGNTLQVGVEGNERDNGKLTYEGNWYVVVELTKDALRIFRHRMTTKELLLLHERKIATSLNEKEMGKMHMAFLMSDRGIRFNPALWLRGAKLRIWGVRQRQLVVMDADTAADEGWRKLGIDKVEQITTKQFSERLALKEITLPVRFETDPSKVGIAGTIGDGTQTIPLALVKAPKGVRVRMEIEALKDDGTLESRHWVEGESDGEIVAMEGATGHIYLGAQSLFEQPTSNFWRWEGVDGKTEVDTPRPNGKPREATKLKVRLVAMKVPANTSVQFVLFAFPETGGFFTPAAGSEATKGAKVRIGEKEWSVGDLVEGEFREVEIGEVAGGEEIQLRCEGSKLALVELIGEADRVMCHALRKVRKDGDKLVWGELTEQAKAFPFYGWDKDIGSTCLWDWRNGRWIIVNDAQ
ncbi:MAG: hypothetical protein SLRJCFUN_002293 [Candidatus Fervidibacter sp.]